MPFAASLLYGKHTKGTDASGGPPQAVIPDPELIHDSSDELSGPSLDDDGGDIFPPFREEGIQVSSLYNDEDRTCGR